MISRASTFLGPKGLFQGSATPSLVLSLDSNNILSYPGTGVTWSDLSIRKNNGILNNVSSVTGSIPSTSLSFDGSSSFISFTQSEGIPAGNSQYTIEAWFNSNSYDVLEQGAIIGWGTISNDNMSNVLRLSANGLTNYWWNNDITFSLSGTSSMIVGNWYYGVATFDGTNRKLYLNGELKETDTPGTHSVSDTSTLKIGHFYNTYFDGKISKVRVSDKAFSVSRILSNFNSNKVVHGYVFGSMTFNDTDSYLISTSNDYVLGTNDFTVEAFFKASTASNPYTGIVSQRQVGNNNISINLQSANTSEPLIEFSSAGTGLSTYTASNDEWYHVAISRTGGTSSYFINGNLVNKVADTTDYTISSLVVGRYYTSYSDYYFNGIICNVRFINGTGLYTGTFSVPEVQLSATYSNTKFLIHSQQTTPSVDVSGLLHSVTASNIGWTSSLPSFAPPYVTESLQFYVDAGLPQSYPGTGTTWFDISGNSRNLTMNSLSYSPNDGGYIIFDGSHTADSVSTYTINFSNGFTVECVAKFSGSAYEGLFAFNDPMNSNYINVQAQGNNIRWEIDSGSSFTTTNSLSSDTWYHVTCVYEGDSNNTSATARIYINGVENNTASLTRTGQNQTSNFVLGQWDGYLTGNIALSRMYNKVLNSTEVLQNFNATKDRFGL